MKTKTASKGVPLVLALGACAALATILVAGAAGLGAVLWYKSRPMPEEQVAGGNSEAQKKADQPSTREHEPEPRPEADPKVAVETRLEPEPKVDFEPLKAPEPDKRPKKKKETDSEPPPQAKSDPLSPELERVKQATAAVRARRPDGTWIEGSGFFVLPGVIVTNAHVLGMLDPKAPPPLTVEVIVNGGQSTERTLQPGYTVDRGADLAILRLNAPDLPMPLAFEDSGKLAADQKVHIAGYPFGRKERKSPTITASTITQAKKDAAGTLEEIQVKGGMSPGTSGGPVVTPTGKAVGVALGAVKDTDIHLAIPTDVVQRLLNGKLGEGNLGKSRAVGARTVIFYQVPLIDPMEKIKQARVDVWVGPPTPARPYAYKQPDSTPGDGPRSTQPLMIQGSIASNELTVPDVIPPGQVAWVQPVIVLKDDSMQWGIAAAMPVQASPYERKAVSLVAHFDKPRDRTIKLKSTLQASDKKGMLTLRTEADILETLTSTPEGGTMRTAYGSISIVGEVGGQKLPLPKPVIDLMRAVPLSYTLDAFGKIKTREFRKLSPDLPKDLRETVLEEANRLASTHEALLASVPNREVQPGETWTSTIPVLIRDKQKSAIVQIALTNTYEGILVKAGRREAIVTVAGKLKSQDVDFKRYEADVTGKFSFDLAAGFFASAEMKLAGVKSGKDAYTLDIELARRAGNVFKIPLPQDLPMPTSKDPPPVAKAKTILDKKAALTAKDPTDAALSQAKKQAHFKDFTVHMDAGKTYVIELHSKTFDGMLKLFGPNKMMVAQDRDSGAGKNARISFRAPATGNYHIHAIASNHKLGAFHLTVVENP